MFILTLGLISLSVWFGITETVRLGSNEFPLAGLGLALLGVIVSIVLLTGFVVLQPNESLVCLLFGSYVGTEQRLGFWWVNPFNSKRKVSRRLETLECGPLKVNDAVGNPVDIGAVVVWRVEDAAKAVLEAVSYAGYVKAQSETALRRMASTHPYDQVEVETQRSRGSFLRALAKRSWLYR
jgi:regulator of protease activity HflC (stomatin/prohibitin superfamily)